MGDNIDVTPGTGATIAADEVGGVLYQAVKLVVGGSGVASLIDASNPLPVNDAGGSLTIDGTVAVSSVGGSVAVTGTFWQATQPVSGTFFQATQPVSIAAAVTVTDGSGSLTVDGTVAVTDGGGSLTVDGSVSAAVTGTVSLTDISAGDYETVAASQTDQVLGATGATGDYLSGVVIVPATGSPGAVSIKDGGGSAITIFTGGANSVSNLVPFFVPLGIKSAAGAWKVTTGSVVSAIGVGNFT